MLNEHGPVLWPDAEPENTAPEAVSNCPTITVPRSQAKGVNVDVRHLRPQNGDSSDICVIEIEGNLAAGTRSSRAAITQVCAVTSQLQELQTEIDAAHSIAAEQQRDPVVRELSEFLTSGKLPGDQVRARKVALQSSLFSLIDGVVYHIDHKTRQKCAVVPSHLQEKLLRETHAGSYSGHFSGRRLYDTLRMSWWWETMFADAEKFAKTCPECVVASGSGRRCKPLLHPIPVQRPFQVLGIDVMDLPVTEKGNRHVVVIQDLFTKWPMVFPVQDQKALRIAKLIAEEVVPLFGVAGGLLSDRGTNFLSHLVLDLCRMLGITKLNTTAHHPQCDGAVERFNRTLKTMLRSMLPVSETSGILTYLEFCGPTETLPTPQPEKNHHSSSLSLTHRGRLHSTIGFPLSSVG